MSCVMFRRTIPNVSRISAVSSAEIVLIVTKEEELAKVLEHNNDEIDEHIRGIIKQASDSGSTTRKGEEYHDFP